MHVAYLSQLQDAMFLFLQTFMLLQLPLVSLPELARRRGFSL